MTLREIYAFIYGRSGIFVGISMVIVYVFFRAIYNVFFHPLSSFPGPLLHRASRLAYVYRLTRGTLPMDLLEMHEHYGDIVRVAPDELSFAHPDAWSDIYKKSADELDKAHWFYRVSEACPLSIISEYHEQHGLLRRQLTSGFSEKSLRDQEPIIRGYIDLLLQRLRENSNNGQPLVISDWFNFTTFDIIGDLVFSKPFGCLARSDYHEWVKSTLEVTRLATVLQSLSFAPLVKRIVFKMVPDSLEHPQKRQMQRIEAILRQRLDVIHNEKNMMEALVRKKEELNLSIDQLISNAQILMTAGSETSASLLSAVTYFLLQNPAAYQKLTNEVRSSFSSEKEINISSVKQLAYMIACLNEALRMYPPVAVGLPRVVPGGGVQILGQYIPEQTFVAIPQWALYHREEYFAEPNAFHPERFLNDPKFSNDRRDGIHPFSLGARSCLGQK
ncbi:cytochrome P450 monooxygenase [Talaromyces pinophilus]|uniref:Cytochrome P450 monooxygenase n=1 Tax=Talaromyces pinophilus TaxID=128442 RepID=A0A6V8H8U8_TALPI|nr:cytochrome P450 monooxygenase [Talaromyces pinophilus]